MLKDSLVADISLIVQIGYETQTVSLTSIEWMGVKKGEHLVKDAQGFYKGVVVSNLSK